MLTSILSGFAALLEQIAQTAAGMASYDGMYQPKEPDCLHK